VATVQRVSWIPLLTALALLQVAGASAELPAAERDSGSAPEDAVSLEYPEATLEVWNRPILIFRAGIGSRTPEKRAALAAQRIADLPPVALTGPVGIIPVESQLGRGVMVEVDDRFLFTIVEADLDPESKEPFDAVVAAAVQRLQDALAARAEQTRGTVLLRGIALSLLATLLFVALATGLFRLRGWIARRAAAASAARIERVSHVDLRQQVGALTRWLVTALCWVIGLLAAYLWLTFVLVEFPYTEPWGRNLGAFLRRVASDLLEGALKAVPGIVFVAVILLITRGVARLASSYFRGVESGWIRSLRFTPETARATRRLLVTILWLFGLAAAYPHIPGSNTEAFRALSVLVGVMVSLGSTGLVNQIVSGLVVIYSRALQPGDYVRIGGDEGLVRGVGMLSIKLATARREEITIPNALLLSSTTVNYSALTAEDGPVTSTTVTIGYDTPWRQVHALLLLAAARTEGVRQSPEPRVAQRALSDFYVEYVLLVNVERGAFPQVVLAALHAQILDVFNEHGVQIMSPHFRAQPEQSVVVPKERWYEPPAQRPAGEGS
jgi:small-conductance mechanosensitive channel